MVFLALLTPMGSAETATVAGITNLIAGETVP